MNIETFLRIAMNLLKLLIIIGSISFAVYLVIEIIKMSQR